MIFVNSVPIVDFLGFGGDSYGGDSYGGGYNEGFDGGFGGGGSGGGGMNQNFSQDNTVCYIAINKTDYLWF